MVRLISPDDFTELKKSGNYFQSKKGVKYKIIDDIPVLLPSTLSNRKWKMSSASQFGEWSGKKNRFLLKRRFDEIIKHIKNPKSILDIGCGDSELINRLNAPEIVGIDIRENLKQNKNGSIYKADAEHLPFKDNSFDCVIMAAFIEHLPSPGKAVKEAYRVLKKNGKLIITTPNPLYHKITDLAASIRLKYAEGNETPMSLSKCSKVLKKSGFKVVLKKYFLFFPFRLPMFNLLEKLISPLVASLNLNQIIIGKK